MIISNIIGGLGNQMFQYAAGRAVALKLDTPYKQDLSGFDYYKLHHGFELSRVFVAPVISATKSDMNYVLGWQSSKLIRKFIRRPQFGIIRKKQYVVEPTFSYWDGINSLSNNSYLEGYWQSEKYFKEFFSIIRADFEFKVPFSTLNATLAADIASTNAVSLHIRRGDYVSNKKNTSIYTVCTLDYYRLAIQEIAEKVTNPVFYIFSDDIPWVRSHLTIERPSVFVDHNKGAESYNDMRLMSLCQHNIIANSSFSWWGAWLNKNPEKIVIAPNMWFSDNTNDTDLIPGDWLRL